MSLGLAQRLPSGDAWAEETGRAALHQHLHTLRDHSIRVRFMRNEAVFNEGQPTAHFYRVVEGCLRLCRHAPDGRRHIADFMLPGDIFGVIEHASYPFTAEAVTNVTLTVFPRLPLDHMTSDDPRVCSDLLTHLSARLLDAHRHLFVLSCQNAKERMASFLVRMADRTGMLPGNILEVSMGRQDIADHLGLTIETVCRAIASLRSDGLISVPVAQRFALVNLNGLRALSEGRTPS